MTYKKVLLMAVLIIIPEVGLDFLSHNFSGTTYAFGFVIGMSFEIWTYWHEKIVLRRLTTKLELLDYIKNEEFKLRIVK